MKIQKLEKRFTFYILSKSIEAGQLEIVYQLYYTINLNIEVGDE